MKSYPPERLGILIMKVIMNYSYPPMLSGILIIFLIDSLKKTSQELRMLSSVTLICQVTKIVMDSGSQL